MSSISLSLQFDPICRGSAPKMPPLDGLTHTILAIALAIFGALASYMGSSILVTTGWNAPAGILLLSCGLIMLGIGLPARINSIQKVWHLEKN